MTVRYNRALDLTALALKEARKGNHINASTLFLAASKDASAGTALKMIEATNDHAITAGRSGGRPATRGVTARRAPARGRRVSANDFEDTDEETMDVLDQLDVEAQDDGDEVDDVDFDEVEDIEVDASAQARSFANVLARLHRRSR